MVIDSDDDDDDADDDNDAASDAAEYGGKEEEEDYDDEQKKEEERLRRERRRQEAIQREELIAASYSYYTNESLAEARKRGKICEGIKYKENRPETRPVTTTKKGSNNNRTTSDQVLVVGATSKIKENTVNCTIGNHNSKKKVNNPIGKKGGTKKPAHSRLRQWNVNRATRIQ